MKTFLSFVKKETRHILRDKRTMLILFGMPVVMMLLFGFAVSTEVRNVRTVVVTSTTNARTQSLVEALSASEYFDVTACVHLPSDAERLMRHQKADIALVFSPGGQLQIITDASDPNMAQLYATYASSILSAHVSAPTAAGNSSPVAARLLYNPQMHSSYNFVPGIMGMLLMLICAMMTSISVVREKERGTMEVLLVSPARPLLVVVAKAVPYLALAFVILCMVLTISHFVLGVPIAGSLGLVFLLSSVYILVALSLGLLISTVARTQLVALLASAMMLILPCILLSGMMYPIESMPRILQWVSAVMPPRYYISAMRKLLIMGTDFTAVRSELCVLVVMAAVLLTTALLNFKNRLDS